MSPARNQNITFHSRRRLLANGNRVHDSYAGNAHWDLEREAGELISKLGGKSHIRGFWNVTDSAGPNNLISWVK